MILDDPDIDKSAIKINVRRKTAWRIFQKLIDRRHTNSVKWDVKDNELPMWVADMDFRTLTAIVEAIQQKAQNGIFGYEEVPQAFTLMRFRAGTKVNITGDLRRIGWFFLPESFPRFPHRSDGWQTLGTTCWFKRQCIISFTTQFWITVGTFFSSDLVLDEQDTYHIDWDDLEAKMAEPLTTLMILCNPHNPVGMIWSAETLAHIGELAAKHYVVVLSDEIRWYYRTWQRVHPFASVNKTNEQNSVTAISPSKTFNVAALHAATVIVPNVALRSVVNRGLNTDELAEPNSFAIPATIAAYTKGHQWVHDLRAYIEDNKQTVAKFVAANVPSVKVVAGDATYLVWLDTSKVGMPADKLEQFIRQETGLYLSDGTVYGGNGREFLRMNVACPKERLMDGLNRLKQGILAVK